MPTLDRQGTITSRCGPPRCSRRQRAHDGEKNKKSKNVPLIMRKSLKKYVEERVFQAQRLPRPEADAHHTYYFFRAICIVTRQRTTPLRLGYFSAPIFAATRGRGGAHDEIDGFVSTRNFHARIAGCSHAPRSLSRGSAWQFVRARSAIFILGVTSRYTIPVRG